MSRHTALAPAEITRDRRLDAAFWICGTTILAALCWVVLALTHLGDPRVGPYLVDDGLLVAVDVCFALVGLFLMVHRTLHGPGSVFLAAGLLHSLRMLALLAAALAGAGPVAVDALTVLVLASDIAYALTVYALPLWLPSGRLPSGRWSFLFPLLVLWVAAHEYYLVAGTADWYGLANPLGHGGWAVLYDRLGSLFGSVDVWEAPAVALAALLVAAVRWYRSRRPHLRMLGILIPYLIWLAAVFLPYPLDFDGRWLFYVGAASWAVGVAFAFAGDRSAYLDRSTRRVMAAFVLVSLLVLANAVLGYLMYRLLPAAATADARWLAFAALVMGVLLRPAAGWVLHAVDRYYYGRRAHPYQVVRRLAERLSLAVDPGDAPGLLCSTVVTSLGVPGARVTITTAGGRSEVAAVGQCPQDAERLPLRFEGAEIGELHVAPRPGRGGLDRQDREVLGFLADQAAPAIASLRLYEELQASRKRIVLAREEERRRLRHDLHDGLGPALSAVRLRLDTARSAAGPGSALDGSLLAASEGIGGAIKELRGITDGLAPAALGTCGLDGALRRLAGGLDGRTLRVSVELDPDPLPQLPAAVEVAVYRISGEALNNVVRHSGATSATLSLRVEADRVLISARDNGAGFPSHGSDAGVGLRSMAERAEELGGRFTAANDATGAVVTAAIPHTAAPGPVD
ncbi:histidine kinase [Kitasatospora sp. NPDC048540]|uniref:sensor histidine kinase n=1 Tax=Kitasatospora sp. NPDC048540 TaxID=3155634 RepID=UPI0033DF5A32